jgi:hypothetical protein
MLAFLVLAIAAQGVGVLCAQFGSGHKSEAEIARMTPEQRVEEYCSEYVRHNYWHRAYDYLLADRIMADGLKAFPTLTRMINEFDPTQRKGRSRERDVSFADESNGWIVGEMGRVYESTDGGASWQSRASQFARLIKVRQPWRVNFKKVSFFSKGVGCMIVEVNDKRDPYAHPSYLRKLVILRTENGSRDWRVRRTIETPQFVAAQFLTQDEWWVRTLPSTVLFHTTDGGKTWSQVKLTDDASHGPVVFLDSNTGWVFSFLSGFSFPNLLTRDGGNTWTTQRINYITQKEGLLKEGS